MNEIDLQTEREDFFRLQMFSSDYQEWVSEENDIYDELFKNGFSEIDINQLTIQ